jgi:hypothetical protein
VIVLKINDKLINYLNVEKLNGNMAGIRDRLVEFLKWPTVDNSKAIIEEIQQYFREKIENHIAPPNLVDIMKEYEGNTGRLVKNHRHHYFHVFYVFALGLCIYVHNQVVREKINEAICRKHFSSSADDNKEPVSGNNIFEIFLYEWSMAAIFHDIAYPFELCVRAVNSYLEKAFSLGDKSKISFVKMGLENIDYLTMTEYITDPNDIDNRVPGLKSDRVIGLIARNLIQDLYRCDCQTMEKVLNIYIDQNLEQGIVDHGVYSAVIFLNRVNREINKKEKKGKKDLESFYLSAVNAAAAIFLHNSYKHFFQKKIGLPKLSLDKHPLAYLLILCDNLQEWAKYESAGNENISDKETQLEISRYDIDIDLESLTLYMPPKKLRSEGLLIDNFPGWLYKEIADVLNLNVNGKSLLYTSINIAAFCDMAEDLLSESSISSELVADVKQYIFSINRDDFEIFAGNYVILLNKYSRSPNIGDRAFIASFLGLAELYPEFVRCNEKYILEVLKKLLKDHFDQVWIPAFISLEKLSFSRLISEYKDKTGALDYCNNDTTGWPRRNKITLAEGIYKITHPEADDIGKIKSLYDIDVFLAKGKYDSDTARTVMDTFPYLFRMSFVRPHIVSWFKTIERQKEEEWDKLVIDVLLCIEKIASRYANYNLEDKEGAVYIKELYDYLESIAPETPKAGFTTQEKEKFSANKYHFKVRANQAYIRALREISPLNPKLNLVDKCRSILFRDIENTVYSGRGGIFCIAGDLLKRLGSEAAPLKKYLLNEFDIFSTAYSSDTCFQVLKMWQKGLLDEEQQDEEIVNNYLTSMVRVVKSKAVIWMKYLALSGLIRIKEALKNNIPVARGVSGNTVLEEALKYVADDESVSKHRYQELDAVLNNFLLQIDETQGQARYPNIMVALDFVDLALEEGVLWQGCFIRLQVNEQAAHKSIYFLINAMIGLVGKSNDYHYINMFKQRLLSLAAEKPILTLQVLSGTELKGFSKQSKIIFEIIEECLYNIHREANEDIANNCQVFIEKLFSGMEAKHAWDLKMLLKNLSRDNHVREQMIKSDPGLIFNDNNSAYFIRCLERDKKLDEIFPVLKELKGMAQGKRHRHDVFEHSLLVLENVECVLNEGKILKPGDMQRYTGAFGKEKARQDSKALIKIAALFHDIGKPETRQISNGKVTFYKHAGVGAKRFLSVYPQLSLGLDLKQAEYVACLIDNHMRLPNYMNNRNEIKDKTLAAFIGEARQKGIYDELLVLFVADMHATGNPLETEEALSFLESLSGV